MVKTGDESDAGTDANVYLQMFGEKGKTQNFALREEGDRRRFERGRMDKFLIRTQDIGKVKRFNYRASVSRDCTARPCYVSRNFSPLRMNCYGQFPTIGECSSMPVSKTFFSKVKRIFGLYVSVGPRHEDRGQSDCKAQFPNRFLSRNAETKDFARLTSHPVRGWTGKNKAFCSPGTQNGRRVIKVYWWTLNDDRYSMMNVMFLDTLCSSRKYPDSPHRRYWNFLGVGDSVKPINLKKCMKLNCNFQRGGEGMDIFWNYTFVKFKERRGNSVFLSDLFAFHQTCYVMKCLFLVSRGFFFWFS